MRFTSKEKAMLFIFGSADKEQTRESLMVAGCLVKKITLRDCLWGVAAMIGRQNKEDYRSDFYGIRMELDPLIYAPSITYDDVKNVYLKEYPVLNLVVQYLFGQCMDCDTTTGKLEMLAKSIADPHAKKIVVRLIEDLKDTVEGDTMAFNNVYAGHQNIVAGVDWLMSNDENENDTEEM